MSDSADTRIKTLNFNVGVLGHVDSGKTSLARALSSTASTAAFDKNPQSRERGITLDLGFSSFTVDLPEHLRDGGGHRPHDSLQFTLVDCPGHASLIRTIIGGELYIFSADIEIKLEAASCAPFPVEERSKTCPEITPPASCVQLSQIQSDVM